MAAAGLPHMAATNVLGCPHTYLEGSTAPNQETLGKPKETGLETSNGQTQEGNQTG